MEIENMSLWKYDDTIKTIIEKGFVYDEDTGEVFFTSDDLDVLEEAVDSKLNNIIGFIKDCQLQSETLIAKAKAADEVYQNTLDKEYRKPALTLAKKAEYLTKYLENYMQSNNLEDLSKENGVAKYSKSTVCEIIDEAKIEDFCRNNSEYKEKFFKVKTEVSKKDIKDYLKAGNSLEGAALVTKKTLKVK